jgi:hypothetical protein
MKINNFRSWIQLPEISGDGVHPLSAAFCCWAAVSNNRSMADGQQRRLNVYKNTGACVIANPPFFCPTSLPRWHNHTYNMIFLHKVLYFSLHEFSYKNVYKISTATRGVSSNLSLIIRRQNFRLFFSSSPFKSAQLSHSLGPLTRKAHPTTSSSLEICSAAPFIL